MLYMEAQGFLKCLRKLLETDLANILTSRIGKQDLITKTAITGIKS